MSDYGQVHNDANHDHKREEGRKDKSQLSNAKIFPKLNIGTQVSRRWSTFNSLCVNYAELPFKEFQRQRRREKRSNFTIDKINLHW